MTARTHIVWDLAAFATSAGGGTDKRVSCPLPVEGNALVLHLLCINAGGGAVAFNARLQGSQDEGLSWTNLGSAVNQSSLGSNSTSQTAVEDGLWRVEATLTGLAGAVDWIGRVSVDESDL